MCRAGLPDRLVQLSVTLCLTYFSHHALNETEADDYMKDEPQNVPSPPTAFHSWNVLGAIRAYLHQWVWELITPSLTFNEETFAELAKEQACEVTEDLPQDEWEPHTMPFYAYVPLSELESLTKPFYASKHLTVLESLTKPCYASKPVSMLSPLSMFLDVLADLFVPVPYCMLRIYTAPL